MPRPKLKRRRKNQRAKAAVVPLSPELPRTAELDLQKLTETLVGGVTALEATLFTQASLECKRLSRLSTTLDFLEKRLFDPQVLESLPYKDKLTLYREARKTQESIFTFLQHLHSMTLGAKEVIAFIDQLKRERARTKSEKDKEKSGEQNLQQLKQLVAEVLLRKKLQGDKNK